MSTSADNNASSHKDPLHGITLENLLKALVSQYGFDGLAAQINIRCFSHDPSIKSSLKFLRKTPWARAKVERLYLTMQGLPIPEHLKHPEASADKTPTTKQVNRDIWGK
ncbi:DUF2132 domain-containing protein [Shewanella yunxiaonensis]|uniref:DUF2132 domain-containing protein n=1 Tax=Shewanella yunxiaonensis TaxID=2829809 RepID=A0ABX7YPH1_9GAMM|nr:MULTISPECIES: VF530 family protein [Shewanella]MDF0533600.1 VF530 family protein [Shewanella sp. A32]QUN04650.1 DUF2132 domain-containing protein [Shewanella yunxiaonensis]